MDPNKSLLIDLEELSALQMDSINGFKELGKKNTEFSAIEEFVRCSHFESIKIWEELNAEIIKLKGETKDQGTLKGAINHLWMKLKKDLLLKDMSSILENIKVCEEFNLERYKKILSDNLPENIRLLLTKHKEKLEARILMIDALQISYKKTQPGL
jgi:uncharacterized protein (TIGR02284 family)